MVVKNLRLETRYFYNYTLTKAEQRLYRFMLDLVLNRQYKFYYVIIPELLPDDKNPDVPRFFAVIEGEDEGELDLYKTTDAVHWDFPEIFYANAMELELDADYLVHIGGKSMPTYTDKEIDEINAKLYEISHRFDLISDEFELELAVHDYITREFDYDDILDERDGKDYQEGFNVVGLIKRGVGVCGALSFLMQFILQQHGIMVANIVKTLPDDELEYHSWLVVRIDGKFYHLDITFDETKTKTLDEPQYTSFNLTDAEIFETHGALGEAYPGIVCNSTDANYYVKKGLLFESLDLLVEATKKFLFTYKDTKKNMLYFYFRTPNITNASVITARFDEIIAYAKALGMKIGESGACVDGLGYGALNFSVRNDLK